MRRRSKCCWLIDERSRRRALLLWASIMDWPGGAIRGSDQLRIKEHMAANSNSSYSAPVFSGCAFRSVISASNSRATFSALPRYGAS
jgi:hypothetical protein